MARQLRLEFPGAIVHVSSRGNERRNIAVDDEDRRGLLELIGKAVQRFRWNLLQYVLMTNHYHFVLELTEQSLSDGMQWLNGSFAQRFNRRHQRVGHLFQGRFDAKLVQKETYLLEVLRYVALNPVRAGMVARAQDYEWSGHRAIAGFCSAPDWLAVRRTLRCFAPDDNIARSYYSAFVEAGVGDPHSPWDDLVGQIYLGEESWITEMRQKIEAEPRSDEIPIDQRRPVDIPMADVLDIVASVFSITSNDIRFGRGGTARMVAAWAARVIARADLRSIAAALRVDSASLISRIVKDCESRLATDLPLRALATRCARSLQEMEKVQSAALTP